MKKSYCFYTMLAVWVGASAPLSTMAVTGTARNVAEQQDQQKLSGVITDRQGDPITGATITIAGKNIGVVSDLNGHFSIAAKPGERLSISYVGYKTVKVAAAHSMKITLEEDAGQINEVVVVGYGTQKKVNLTGAVANVNDEEAN